MALGREHGYTNAFYWLPAEMAALCVKALDAGIETEYVRDLVLKRNLFPASPPLQCKNWPWALEIFTLGRFSLLKDGTSIKFSKKVPRKIISLLKVLIAFGGREVNEYKITQALWPDADGQTAHSAFTTALQRLRQITGHEDAIRVRDGHVTLNPRFCYVDVWAFERAIGQAEAAERSGETGKSMDFMQKAIDLYRGAFLGDDTEEVWAASFRERLRSKFLRSVIWLGKCREEEGGLEQAIEYYKKGLEVDDLAEGMYQSLMNCYCRMGLRAEALSVYNRCHKTLLSTLGIEPSSKTKDICRKIRGSD